MDGLVRPGAVPGGCFLYTVRVRVVLREYRGPMRFILIDKIVRCRAGERIVTSKSLSLAEEYLGDHFPTFPVLPGVLMVEAMVQSAAWLVRVTEDFAHSMIVLRVAKNVSYGSFLAPGGQLEYEIEPVRIESASSEFKAVGRQAGRQTVKARFELAHYNVADRRGGSSERDARAIDSELIEHLRRQFVLLGGPSALQAGDNVVAQG